MTTLHKKTTAKRQLDEQTWISVEYGFDVEFARRYNQAAHFSITCDRGPIHRYLDGGEPVYGASDSGGADHESIAKAFPELAPLIPWHLCAWREGPMHYKANALHWFKKIGLPKERSYDPDPEKAFRSTVICGALPDDEARVTDLLARLAERQVPSADLDKGLFDGKQEALFAAPRMAVEDACAAWLDARRRPLLDRFEEVMQTFGLATPPSPWRADMFDDQIEAEPDQLTCPGCGMGVCLDTEPECDGLDSPDARRRRSGS